MSYLKGKKAYLSGPIQFGTGTNWRIDPTKYLTTELGIDLFDPFADAKQQWLPILQKAKEAKDLDLIRQIAMDFVQKDLNMVDKSDFLIAYLPFRVPTTGTTHEIIRSSDGKKPTLLICPEGRENVPLWFFGFIRPEFMFGSWNELYSYLCDVNVGKYLKNRRWRTVCGVI